MVVVGMGGTFCYLPASQCAIPLRIDEPLFDRSLAFRGIPSLGLFFFILEV